MSDRKKYWQGVQSTLKTEKIRLLQVKRKYNRMRRSLSCLVDYKRLQVDEVDKYLNKKNNNKQQPNNKQHPNNKKAENTSSDFSMLI